MLIDDDDYDDMHSSRRCRSSSCAKCRWFLRYVFRWQRRTNSDAYVRRRAEKEHGAWLLRYESASFTATYVPYFVQFLYYFNVNTYDNFDVWVELIVLPLQCFDNAVVWMAAACILHSNGGVLTGDLHVF